MKHILGVSSGFHDAAVSLLSRRGDIVFAGHSERYSKIKHDARISSSLIAEVENFDIDHVAYYERPWCKQLMKWYSGQGFDIGSLSVRQTIKQQLPTFNLTSKKISGHRHHLCHAAAGFQTSPFDKATVVVIDAIGEWDTISIWLADYDSQGQARYRLKWRQSYPHSIGLLYSAATQRVGLRPLDEEYILMGMSAFGIDLGLDGVIKAKLMSDEWDIKFKHNLHVGLETNFLDQYSDFDIARGVQTLTEDLVLNVMCRARNLKYSENLVYMGGVALNCVANARLGEYFNDIWIMPCPGDAGSSLGAAALVHGGRINWTSAFLGHNIPGDYPVNAVLDNLVVDKICGVASGRAEFGPRALGNRSLLADPRGPEVKDRVNEIKRRQKFRPFAPAILEEHAEHYFDMPPGWHNSRYMQTIACSRYPDLFPAVIHHDGSSRVQTVPQDGSGLRALLEKWFVLTGCPMLLNTSLNIRGEPMVNDRRDADRFEKLYGLTVCS